MKDIAIVFCMHANPAIGMSSLISTFVQNLQKYSYDVHFIYQVGPDKIYPDMIKGGINRQLSPYDPRVEEITDVNYDGVYRWRFQNDHGLDSGAWWNWILNTEEAWRNYRYVWFCSEDDIAAQIRTDEPEAVTYTVGELREIINVKPNPEDLKAIHNAKSVFLGSRVIESNLKKKNEGKENWISCTAILFSKPDLVGFMNT